MVRLINPAGTYSSLTMETPEQRKKSVQSQQQTQQNDVSDLISNLSLTLNILHMLFCYFH